MRIIVTDCHYKMSLAPIRALKKANYDVLCGDYADIPEKALLGAASKGMKHLIRWDRGKDPAGNLMVFCSKEDVILPVGRDMIRALAAHEQNEHCPRYLVSDIKTLDLADNKAAVYQLATQLQIPAPASFILEDGTDPAQIARDVRYPCILKYHNGEEMGLHSHERYAIAHTEEEFLQAYSKMAARSSALLVQDYLTGPDVGIAVVMDEQSRPVDFLCYESQLEYPISGGPTCLCRTFFDRELLKRACRLLQAMNFKGIAMLDFKRSGDELYLLEINPRVWGSAMLTQIANATFFESYVKAAQGCAAVLDPDRCTPSYNVGSTMKFFPQILLSSLKELLGGKHRTGASHLGSALSPCIRDGLFSVKDPKPFVQYILHSRQGQ